MIPQHRFASETLAAERQIGDTTSVAGGGILRIERRSDGQSIVTQSRAESPLRLLTPSNHGHAPWVYIATFGGGLVDGDAIDLTVDIDHDAWGVLSTQAHGKVYPGHASQAIRARVGDNGLLASLPDPTVCFAGAHLKQSAHVELGREANLLWLESLVSGRSAHGERWQFGSYESAISVARQGTVTLSDTLLLNGAIGPSPILHMKSYEWLATLVVIGPAVRAIADAIARPPPSRDMLVSVHQRDDATLVRLAATNVEAGQALVQSWLRPLAGLLGDDLLARKW